MSALDVAITIDAEGQQLIERLRTMPTLLRRAIREGMNKGGNLLLGQITRQRFTGRGPFPVGEHRLGLKTNRLRSSLRWQSARIEPDGSVSAGIGTNVEYMAAHEFGFSGEVQVRAFRRSVSASQFAKAGTGVDISKIKGKKARKEALGLEDVRAHRRTMKLPERAPLRTGVEEGSQMIVDEITAALERAWDNRGPAT